MIWTLGLWLEEPRLHEPTLYLPALPPLYNAEKLASILQGDRVSRVSFKESNICLF